MISLKYKFLFIHPQKTAGTSVEKVLSKYCEYIKEGERVPIQSYKGRPTKHMNPRFYSNNWDTRGFFKFATVRNPWGKYLSHFFMLSDKPWTREYFHEFISQCTNGFVRARFSFMPEDYFEPAWSRQWKNHARARQWEGSVFDLNSQYKKLLIEHARPGEEMDHFIHYNTLQEDFDEACDRIGIPREELPHFGKGAYREDDKHYTDFYDDELIEMIRENYKDDIDYFGFEYGE
jgi:hypothetical protein